MSASPPVQSSDSAVRSVICVHRQFERSWPYAADHWQRCWQQTGGCELIRTAETDATPAGLVADPASVQRLVLLGFALGTTAWIGSPLSKSATSIGNAARRRRSPARRRAA